jgi:integrase
MPRAASRAASAAAFSTSATASRCASCARERSSALIFAFFASSFASWQDVDLDAGTLTVRQTLQRFGGNRAARKELLAKRRALLSDLRAAWAARKAAPPMRRAALATRIRELDAEARTLWRQLHAIRGQLHVVEPKSATSRRTIVLPSVVLMALKAHRVRQLEERLSAGGAWHELGCVFTTTIGTPLEPRNVTREFKAVLASAALPEVRFHDLRHTAATLLLVQGVSPRTVMETLGHAQVAITLNTYSHVLPELRREAAAKMDAILLAES